MHLLAAVQPPLSMVDRMVQPTQPVPLEEPAADSPVPPLTPREVEVLSLVSEGLLARTIASRLDVSDRTVHKHLGNVYRKLDTHDRLLAVRRAETMGLLPRR
jgi:DNA-binding NarL/FixJ family response regulator